MQSVCIRVDKLSKAFHLYARPVDRLKALIFKKDYHHHHQALSDVSFTVSAGETLGIVGPNGAGKSTLLKLLTGILLPDSGTIETNGRVTGLLELGTGFNPDLTGRQNIDLNAAMLGMSKTEIFDKTPEMIDFAEIGAFIDEPLNTYSSGMNMRLAFSIAIHADPVCFIVDEALSVGDVGFQQKCIQRIRDFKKQGGAIVFVSHDMNALKQLCDKAIMLEAGQVTAYADPDSIVNRYHQRLAARAHQGEDYQTIEGQQSAHGTLEARITAVTLNGNPKESHIVTGGKAQITVQIHPDFDMEHLSVGIIIRDQFGQDIYGTNTYLQGEPLNIKKDKPFSVSFTMEMNIGPGAYTIGAAIHRTPDLPQRYLNWVDNALAFTVIQPSKLEFNGLCRLSPSIEIKNGQSSK